MYHVLAELSFWFKKKRYSFDICTVVLNIYEFLVCLLVCLLAYILKEIMLTLCFPISWWNFWRLFWVVSKLNPDKYISQVCLFEFTSLIELKNQLFNFSVLVLTFIPLVLLPFGSLGVSFWDLWSCFKKNIRTYSSSRLSGMYLHSLATNKNKENPLKSLF